MTCGLCAHLGPPVNGVVGYCRACCTWQRATDEMACEKWREA